MRRAPILSCPAGHPVRHATDDEVLAAVLDPDWVVPDTEAECLFCGPAGQERALAAPARSGE